MRERVKNGTATHSKTHSKLRMQITQNKYEITFSAFPLSASVQICSHPQTMPGIDSTLTLWRRGESWVFRQKFLNLFSGATKHFPLCDFNSMQSLFSTSVVSPRPLLCLALTRNRAAIVVCWRTRLFSKLTTKTKLCKFRIEKCGARNVCSVCRFLRHFHRPPQQSRHRSSLICRSGSLVDS